MLQIAMPPKKRLLEGAGPDGEQYYVDTSNIVHYGSGQRRLHRLTVADAGNAKDKTRKNITHELVFQRIAEHIELKEQPAEVKKSRLASLLPTFTALDTQICRISRT